MSGLETLLASHKSSLISALDFSSASAPGIADYIPSGGRSQVQIFPSGGSTIDPSTGSRLLRFAINSHAPFIDMSSLYLRAHVHNKDADAQKTLQFLGSSLGCCIQQHRTYLAGTEVDRVDHANRAEEIYERMLPADKRSDRYGLGFTKASGDRDNEFLSNTIAASSGRVVHWQPLTMALVSQGNYIPCAFLGGTGLICEFLLVNDPAECTKTSGTNSNSWRWDDVRLLVDTVSVDQSLLTSYISFLLRGGALQLSGSFVSNTIYAITSQKALIQHARSYTRTNAVIVTFFKADSGTRKFCNSFYLAPTGKSMTMSTMVGVKTMPDHKIESISEYWLRFLSTMGLLNSSTSPSFSQGLFDTGDCFFACQDLESVPGQSKFSGMSTHGASLTVSLDNIATAAELPTQAMVTIVAEYMITIEQDGCSLAI